MKPRPSLPAGLQLCSDAIRDIELYGSSTVRIIPEALCELSDYRKLLDWELFTSRQIISGQTRHPVSGIYKCRQIKMKEASCPFSPVDTIRTPLHSCHFAKPNPFAFSFRLSRSSPHPAKPACLCCLSSLFALFPVPYFIFLSLSPSHAPYRQLSRSTSHGVDLHASLVLKLSIDI